MDFVVAPTLLLALLAVQRYKAVTRQTAALVVGVDIGGTALKVGIFQVSPSLALLVAETEKCFPGKMTAEELCDRVFHVSNNLLLTALMKSWKDVRGVGVALPGRVDNHSVVSVVANFRLLAAKVDLASLLKSRMKQHLMGEVFVLNDAKAALLGEMHSGAMRNTRDGVLITLGTGLGAAVVSDGKIMQGHTGMFGEIGHSIIQATGEESRLSEATGVRGIAEEYASAKAMETTWHHLLPDLPYPGLQRVFASSSQQEEAVVEFAYDQIGIICINAARCYDPSLICLGGGLVDAMCSSSEDDEVFLERVNQAVNKRHWNLAPPTFTIVKARLGNQAGMYGAASYVIMQLFK
jgi:glucokinase